MAIFTVFRVEWRRIWRNKLTRAGMIVGLILPLLYSFLYLWAFWNPYGSLDRLPVAIVNADSGGTLAGKTVNYGRDLTKNLETDKQLGWHVVSNQLATAGVQDGTYFAVLKVPSGFTREILSVSGTKPRAATLELLPNQGSNYLAGKIISEVKVDVAASLNRQFSQQFIHQLLDVVGQESSGLGAAAHSAKTLAAGSSTLADGTKQLHGGMVSANSAALQLASGMTQLTTASQTLASGLGKTTAGTKAVAAGVKKAGNGIGQIQTNLSPAVSSANALGDGLSQASAASQKLKSASSALETGTGEAVTGAGNLATGSKTAQTAATEIQQGVSGTIAILNRSPTNQNPNVQQALSILNSLAPATTQLPGSLGQLSQGATSLQSSLEQLQSGQSQVTSGLGQLAGNLNGASEGAQQLATGLGQANTALLSVESGLSQAGASLDKLAAAQSQLQNGAGQLSGGLQKAAGGAQQLSTGINSATAASHRLQTGATKLSSGATTFADKLNNANLARVGGVNEKAKLMSNPVTIRSLALNPVTKYGPGLTPYFLPLSLWVGALMLYFIMSLREGRWRLAPVSGVSVLLGKFSVLWSIGALQAIIAASALLFGLGLNVTNIIGFYLYAIAMAITYVTIIGALLMLLGTGPGRFLSIVLLLLQLTSSGGTFPVQLVPGFFQALHPWLPMSYAVTGLRRIIAFHDLQSAWSTAAVTFAYLLAALGVALLVNQRRLRPTALKIPDRLVS